jgi:hypothetical protein
VIFEAVAVALEGKDLGVMDEPVDHGDDDVAEDLAPDNRLFEVTIIEACS